MIRPYSFNFQTTTNCNSDCGIAIVVSGMTFGNYCGYRYYAAQGNPRTGMGCKGAFGRPGTVWVK